MQRSIDSAVQIHLSIRFEPNFEVVCVRKWSFLGTKINTMSEKNNLRFIEVDKFNDFYLNSSTGSLPPLTRENAQVLQ